MFRWTPGSFHLTLWAREFITNTGAGSGAPSDFAHEWPFDTTLMAQPVDRAHQFDSTEKMHILLGRTVMMLVYT